MGLNPTEGPDFVSVCIDDMLIFSLNLEEHLGHLRKAFERLEGAGLKSRPSKCSFKTNPGLVSAVKQFPTPRNIMETRRFLGLSSFIRSFIPLFSKVS